MEPISIMQTEADYGLIASKKTKFSTKNIDTKNEVLSNSVNSNDLKSNKENNILHKENQSYQRWTFNLDVSEEIRLEEVPRHVLRNYGIIIEEVDSLKDEFQESMDLQDGSEDDEVEEEEEEGKLVIDEQSSEVLMNVMYIDVPDLKIPKKQLCCSYKECQCVFYSVALKCYHEKLHCPICSDLFTEENILKEHIDKHCDFRGCLDLIEEGEREKHKKTHQHPLKPFQCTYCKKRFHYYGYSKKHSIKCRVLKKKYFCSLCKINFTKIGHYRRHVAKHSQELNCVDCGKVYVDLNGYNKHLLEFHDKHIVYQCKKCQKRYKSQDAMIKHCKCHNLNVTQDCNLTEYIKVEKKKF